MNKNIIGIFVCILFIGASIIPSISGNFEEKQSIKKLDNNVLDYTDHFILDQHQDVFNPKSGTLVEYNEQRIAQSFKPSITSLAKVDIAIDSSSTVFNSPVFVSIRTELDGAILTSISVPASEISTDKQWYAFDFPDILVIPENTYYIQIEEEASENGYGYSLGLKMGEGFDFYSRGKQWGYWDHGTEGWYWKNNDIYEYYWDIAFRTYGFNNTPPNKPTITGKTNGKPNTEYEYKFVSTDPENDEISYFIDWGDNTNSGWTRTLPSGEYYNSSHTWSEKGNYTIQVKVKDKYGAESDWETLSVSMLKSKSIYLIKYFFKRYFKLYTIKDLIQKDKEYKNTNKQIYLGYAKIIGNGTASILEAVAENDLLIGIKNKTSIVDFYINYDMNCSSDTDNGQVWLTVAINGQNITPALTATLDVKKDILKIENITVNRDDSFTFIIKVIYANLIPLYSNDTTAIGAGIISKSTKYKTDAYNLFNQIINNLISRFSFFEKILKQ